MGARDNVDGKHDEALSSCQTWTLFPGIACPCKGVLLDNLENFRLWKWTLLRYTSFKIRLLQWKSRRGTKSFWIQVLVSIRQNKFTSTTLKSKGNRIPKEILMNKGWWLGMHPVIATVKEMWKWGSAEDADTQFSSVRFVIMRGPQGHHGASWWKGAHWIETWSGDWSGHDEALKGREGCP